MVFIPGLLISSTHMKLLCTPVARLLLIADGCSWLPTVHGLEETVTNAGRTSGTCKSAVQKLWGNQWKTAKILHFHVEKIITHPAHKIGNLAYDIGLMKVKGRMPYIWKRTTPASLPISKHSNQWPLTGMNCTFVGWGCTKYGGKSVHLASVTQLEVVSKQNCGMAYRMLNLKTAFCAGYFNPASRTCPVSKI
ncbi:hypothetical protein P879_10738 [Paragonimus westermani]|uniref:Peptidase S1 domain-containing protein n=1 Tax=Paragonimus westermani TaxID=34504 RepID=A0A8T0DDM1_9TREM|nr:hypothetical protein P879_10738 [Paragonimus westermani]